MSENSVTQMEGEQELSCGVAGSGKTCAVVSWVMPLVATAVLLIGLRYPVVRVFNIVFVAFGIMATVRSILHIRRYGGCGLGGHVAVGVVLNVLLIALIMVYVFIGLDAFVN